jgi:hypothetical protein
MFYIKLAFAVNSPYLVSASTCENVDVEYPKGIYNPASGSSLYLSNIIASDEFIFSGGAFDSDDVYEGAVSM